MGGVARHFSELRVYQAAFDLQQFVFELTSGFPREERYALTDQLRRSSRSVGANIAEAWQKRRYEAHFVSKLSDADAEFAETEHWLQTARACEYIADKDLSELKSRSREVGRMLGAMMRDSKRWCTRHEA
jgi:four helix bundle protein